MLTNGSRLTLDVLLLQRGHAGCQQSLPLGAMLHVLYCTAPLHQILAAPCDGQIAEIAVSDSLKHEMWLPAEFAFASVCL